MLSCSFYCAAAHRDLRAFPTRRSSDLRKLLLRQVELGVAERDRLALAVGRGGRSPDRKSTRLNSSHVETSYAAFRLQKKIHGTKSPLLAESRSRASARQVGLGPSVGRV